jgi:hypothetical protein
MHDWDGIMRVQFLAIASVRLLYVPNVAGLVRDHGHLCYWGSFICLDLRRVMHHPSQPHASKIGRLGELLAPGNLAQF